MFLEIVKGIMFENVMEEIINKTYPDYTYVNTALTAHSGDGILTSPTNLKCIVEMKNYTSSVTSSQIEKLKYDMKITGHNYGLMLSANSSIQGKKNLDIETFIIDGKKYYIVFVSYYFQV